MKTLIKLLIVAILANAGWHAWLVYSNYFRFKDAIESASSADKSEVELRDKVLDIASDFDVPLKDDGFTVRRESPDVGEQRTVIEGSYPNTLDLAPGVSIPVTLTFRVTSASIRIK